MKGILLINLGSPDSPTTPAVRRYLRQFLMDRHVIDIQWALRFLVPAAGAMLALAAALAAATFVKAFGVSFLGRPRSSAASQAHEVDGWSVTTMLGLAGLCALAGIMPGATP